MDIHNPSATVTCWVDMYSDKLYSWALYKTSKKEIAEDLVQETFIAAFQSIEKFAGKSDVQTWLFAILKNKIAAHFRKTFRSADTGVADMPESIPFFDKDGSWNKEDAPEPWLQDDAHLLDNPAFTEVLHACMANLPENWRAALHLKYLEEKKGEQVCQELGISTTNYWQVLHRAKLQLRKCLENHWFKK